MTVQIRDARPEDWDRIWPFFRDICRAGETYTYPTDLSYADGRAIWMKHPPGRTVVAVDDLTVLGTAEMCPNHSGPGAHVANASFMVDPAHGRRGVGRALVEHVIERCREDGYRAIQFNAVAATNTHAVRLYTDLGFTVVGTVPEAFHHPREGYVGLHVMHLPLG